jgi:hypothetical protein
MLFEKYHYQLQYNKIKIMYILFVYMMYIFFIYTSYELILPIMEFEVQCETIEK